MHEAWVGVYFVALGGVIVCVCGGDTGRDKDIERKTGRQRETEMVGMGRARESVYISPGDVSHCHCPMANANIPRKKEKNLTTGHMLEPHY